MEGDERMLDGRLSITEVAKELGVSTKTITRWEKAGKIKQAKRDWRGWRVYSHAELEEMKSMVEAVY
ncbi:MAG: MerR family transcriptional regulator [Candidatus Omnitrophica bacterium]|nr:MerR family transcriptional regulator [Candidatus Omnitrophota bacterium]